jgi:hypothetical protein
MRLLLGVPALQAHSMLMYTGWRNVVAEFVASRTGSDPSDLIPQTVAWTLLATALAAYEQWLDDPNADLEELLTQGSRILSLGLDDVLAPSAGSRQGSGASTGNLN